MKERIGGDFTLDDAAAVCLYTFDFGDDGYEMNPYNLLNRVLRAEKNVTKEIVKVRDCCILVMAIMSVGCKDPAPNLTAQKAPLSSSGDVVIEEYILWASSGHTVCVQWLRWHRPLPWPLLSSP